MLFVDLYYRCELVEGVHQGLPFADDYEIVSVEHFGEWFESVAEDADPVAEERQALVFLHELERDLRVELRKGVEFLHCAVLEVGGFAAQTAPLLKDRIVLYSFAPAAHEHYFSVGESAFVERAQLDSGCVPSYC